MALFKTTEELKEYVSVNVSTDINSIMPDIKNCEETLIKKYLGKAQYEALSSAYEADPGTPISDDLKKLLVKCQNALANLAYAKYAPIGQVQISDAGIRITTDGNNKTAFKWQVADAIQYFLQNGYNALEGLLVFLEENKTTYADWASSSAYTHFKKYFINSAEEFSVYYNIKDSRLTFLSLLSIMKKVEDFILKPALSPSFFKEIKDEILTGTISSDTQALLDYICPAVAHLTISKAVGELSVDFTGDAFFVNQFNTTESINDKSTPGNNLFSIKKNQAQKDGETYLKELKTFLNKTASSILYNTYLTSDAYVDPADGDKTVLKNSETTKIWKAL